MDIVKQHGEIGGWHIDTGSEYGCPARMATKYRDGRGYEIESQLVWCEYFEGEPLPKEEHALLVKIGRFGGIETVPLEVLVWLMTGQTKASRRAS